MHVQTCIFKPNKLMATTNWKLDPTHSELQFKVRHLMIANVSGNFTKFDATIETENDDLSTAKISFTADVDSITTNNEQRDGHLKSGDFFDVATYPQLAFVATGLEKKDEEYHVNGNLSMHGVTHPVSLHVEHGGVTKDAWGNTRTGFTLQGKVNRKDYGLTWNAATETGGVVLSEDVKIHADVQFIKA